jgi:hypothetical protein
MRLARREHDLDTADGEGQCADGRTLHEGAPFDIVHGFPSLIATPRRLAATLRTMLTKFNACWKEESSGPAAAPKAAGKSGLVLTGFNT